MGRRKVRVDGGYITTKDRMTRADKRRIKAIFKAVPYPRGVAFLGPAAEFTPEGPHRFVPVASDSDIERLCGEIERQVDIRIGMRP